MIGVFGVLFIVCIHTITIQGNFIEESHITLPTERVEKFTHLHFYFHDIFDGEHPTSMKLIDPPSHSPGGFGVTFVVDNLLTEGLELSSKVVGRAQGTFALTSLHDIGFTMLINFFFIEGGYEGSTLSLLGRNAVFDEIREMPIVGGSGAFRFARGYAQAKTIWSNATSGNTVVEYNVSVYHF